jgi:hypothetical protein
VVFKFFRLTRKSDVQDVELKVALPQPHTEIKPTVDIEPPAVSVIELKSEASPNQDEIVVPESVAAPVADVTPAADLSAKVEESALEAGVPQEAPENPEPNVLGQMETIKATREDVIAAYKIFLGRLPESMEAVDPRVGVSPSAILLDFLISKEFLDQASKSQLILAVAKKILDERKQTSPPDEATPSDLGLKS